jgi:hypothetical protein
MDFSTILVITFTHILFGGFCYWAGRNPVEARDLWGSIKKLLKKEKKADPAPTPPPSEPKT